ncbi:filamin abp280 repeat-containing protein [Cyclospora cayetanensis]|uniref:Filamin abp280 repeat-containing protein n=1 Tax=Cyclospora cayetanensis TaxID=88456 RepID=A0A1D3CWW6_9EIME|nr:filamin abp280 repeat-containing protein [Cyclospora cayetanensis]
MDSETRLNSPDAAKRSTKTPPPPNSPSSALRRTESLMKKGFSGSLGASSVPKHAAVEGMRSANLRSESRRSESLRSASVSAPEEPLLPSGVGKAPPQTQVLQLVAMASTELASAAGRLTAADANSAEASTSLPDIALVPPPGVSAEGTEKTPLENAAMAAQRPLPHPPDQQGNALLPVNTSSHKSVSYSTLTLFSGHFVARYPSPALLRCCLQLYVGAIRHLEVTPHPSSGCLAPPEALSGVTECRGAFGASGSLTVCCILWTPLEDPFEVFSISQGTYWLPGWGRRVTAAVSTRPCRKQNALGQDDAEVQQDLEIAVSSSLSNSLKTEKAETGASSSVVAASAEFDGGTPIAFLSVLHIHQRLAHDLSIETHPFRGADPWTSPHNVMSNKATPYVPKKPCISILGTAILPLAHLLATSRKSVQRVDCMRKEREGLLSVTALWRAVCRYRHHYQHERRPHLLRLLSKASLSPAGIVEVSVSAFRQRCINWQALLGKSFSGSSKLKKKALLSANTLAAASAHDDSQHDTATAKAAEHAGSMIFSKKEGGAPSDGKDIIPLAEILKDEESNEEEENEQQQSLATGARRPIIDVVRRVCLIVKRVFSLPLQGPARALLSTASLSIVALWEPESRNKIFFSRATRRVVAEFKCELEPQPFDTFAHAIRVEEELFGQIHFNTKVVLPVLPGIDPVLCLFICVDGTPYAKLQEPIDLLHFASKRVGKDPVQLKGLNLPLTSAEPSKSDVESSIESESSEDDEGGDDAAEEGEGGEGGKGGRDEASSVAVQKRGASRIPCFFSPAVAAESRVVPKPGEGPIVAEMCVAEGAGLVSGVAGEWCFFTLKAKNRRGATVRRSEGTLRVSLEPQGFVAVQVAGNSSEDLALEAALFNKRLSLGAVGCRASSLGVTPQLQWEVVELVAGGLQVSYKHDVPGCYKLHVTYDGLPIAGSPFEILLTSGKPCALASRIIGKGARVCYASPSALDVDVTAGAKPRSTSSSPLPSKSSAQEKEASSETQQDPYDDDNWPPDARLLASSSSPSGAAAEKDAKDVMPKNKRQHFKHFINRFKVVVCDTNGNRVPTGGHCLTVRASRGARVLRVRDERNGVYTVDYVVRAPRGLIMGTATEHLRLADTVASLLTFQQQHASDALVYECNKLQKEGCLPFTSCRLEVLLFEKPLIASPLQPLVANLEQIQRMYKQAQSATQLGASIEQFEEHLRGGRHDEAARILSCVHDTFTSAELRQQAETALANISLRDALDEGLSSQLQWVNECEEEGGDDTSLHLTPKEKQKKEEKRLKDLQTQWEQIQAVRELLLKLSKDNERQKEIIQAFTETMLQALQQTQARNLRLLAERNDIRRLRDENLLPLADVLQQQYLQLFRSMTKQIMTYVTSLNGRDFFNLEELIHTYNKIADELRLLHRYGLADTFDELSRCICEEIELQRLEHIYQKRQELCSKAEEVIAQKEGEIKDVRIQHEARFRNVEPLDPQEVEEICVTREQKGVQTEDALSLREGALGPLIVARATGQRAKQPDAVCALAKVEALFAGDICILRQSAKRGLAAEVAIARGSPRRTDTADIPEVLFRSEAAGKSPQRSDAGMPLGIRTKGKEGRELACFFEKFSVEPDEGLIRPEGFMRVLPLFLWLPCVRELAYLNLVHALSAEAVIRGSERSASILKFSHPSRLIAFHHFCTVHLVPLYEHLYNTRDFGTSLSTLMPDGGPSEVSKTSERSRDIVELRAYGCQQLPVDVFSLLLLEPLEHLFVFYSELSMNPGLSKYRSRDVSPLALDRRKAAAAEVQRQKELYSSRGAPGSHKPSTSGRKKATSVAPKLPIELSATPATSLAEDAHGEGEEQASDTAWVSAGVFIRMLRELGVLPGFMSLETAKSIAMVSSMGGEGSLQSTPEDSGAGEATDKHANSAVEKKGRLVFAQFVEAVVQCICTCTVQNLTRRLQLPEKPSRRPPDSEAPRDAVYCRISEIREEAKQLLDLFGILSLPSVLALTKRPLKRNAFSGDNLDKEGNAPESPPRQQPNQAGSSTAKQQKPVAGLRVSGAAVSAKGP